MSSNSQRVYRCNSVVCVCAIYFPLYVRLIMNNSTTYEFPYWKEVSLTVVLLHVTFIYLPSMFLNLTTLFATLSHQYPVKPAKIVLVSIFTAELLNMMFSGTISLFSFTLCLGYQYCTLVPVHLFFGLFVQYLFAPLMLFWLAIFQLSLIKCKRYTCSYAMTTLYVATVAFTLLTLYIIGVSFLDGQNWCMETYNGHKATENKSTDSLVVIAFVMSCVWTLAMVAIFVLYAFTAVPCDPSHSTSKQKCRKIATFLCTAGPLILILSAMLFTNTHVQGIAVLYYSGGWMVVAVILPNIFSDVAGVIYPLLLLSILPLLAERWKATISSLSSLVFKHTCPSLLPSSCPGLRMVDDTERH